MPNAAEVADRLEQAAHTLRRLPRVTVQGFKSTWPEIVRQFIDAYGWDGARVRLGPPTARQISEMDEALQWLLWLSGYEAKLVWLRACRVRWKVIEQRFSFGRRKLHDDWTIAIMKISFTLSFTNTRHSKHSGKELKLCAQNSCAQNA